MHRHGYKGRKLGRKRDQRKALLRNLAKQLIEHGSIETTLPKAKEVLPMTEKLITKAKKGDLVNRRLIISKLSDVAVANLLVDQIAPQLADRKSGFLRIEKTDQRVGDNAQLAIVEFVDEINYEKQATTEIEKESAETVSESKEDK